MKPDINGNRKLIPQYKIDSSEVMTPYKKIGLNKKKNGLNGIVCPDGDMGK
jgi:hypothetical protein